MRLSLSQRERAGVREKSVNDPPTRPRSAGSGKKVKVPSHWVSGNLFANETPPSRQSTERLKSAVNRRSAPHSRRPGPVRPEPGFAGANEFCMSGELIPLADEWGQTNSLKCLPSFAPIRLPFSLP
jgi:hypothetical protein